MEGHKSEVTVISSQFCIRIGDDEIELIYDHSHQLLTVYVDAELVIQSPFTPRRESFNYVNLIDIAAKMRAHHYRKKQLHQQTTDNSTREDHSQESTQLEN